MIKIVKYTQNNNKENNENLDYNIENNDKILIFDKEEELNLEKYTQNNNKENNEILNIIYIILVGIKININFKQNLVPIFQVTLLNSIKIYKNSISYLILFRHLSINHLKKRIYDIFSINIYYHSLLNQLEELDFYHEKKGVYKCFNLNKNDLYQKIIKNNKILLDNDVSNYLFSHNIKCLNTDIINPLINNLIKDEIAISKKVIFIFHYKLELDSVKIIKQLYDEKNSIKQYLEIFKFNYPNISWKKKKGIHLKKKQIDIFDFSKLNIQNIIYIKKIIKL